MPHGWRAYGRPPRASYRALAAAHAYSSRMRTSLNLEFDNFLKVDVYSRERAPTAPAPFAGAASGLAGLVLGLLLGALRTTEGRVVLPFAYKSSKSTPSSPVPAVSSSSRR